MRNANKILLAAAMLVVPATGTAQVTNHVSVRIGLFASSQPSYWPGVGLGLAYQPVAGGYDGYYEDGYYEDGYYEDGYYHDGYHPVGRYYLPPCWDSFWWDLFLDCGGYYPVGYSTFAPWGLHGPGWAPFGFVGWPSRRYVRQHWYPASPFWGGYDGWGHGGWNWYPGYRRWAWDYRDYRGNYGYTGHYGYPSRYGYGRDRMARHSPLFGPRYKEDPQVYVTDNGPARPVSRAVPRRNPSSVAGLANPREDRGTIGDRQARPRSQARPRTNTDTRTARPQVRARPEPPRATSRPGSTRPSTRSAPSRIRTPAVRTAAPRVRSNPRSAPRVRPAPPRRSAPEARPALPRRSPPKVGSSAPRRSPPKVRAAPRRPAPKARPAPRRPAPKARPAPRRPAPKARAAPRRPAPKVRAAPRRSGGAKAPPKRSRPPRRRGG